MDILDFGYALIIILLVVAGFMLMKHLFIKIADSYIEKNKEQLFEDTAILSEQCKELGIKILDYEVKYYEIIDKLGLNRKYKCSNSVVSNAAKNKIKYLMKYAYIENDIECMEQLDFCINFMILLESFDNKIYELNSELMNYVPGFVKIFASKNKVPYVVCDIDYSVSNITYPIFSFIYISPAGKSRSSCHIEVTKDMLCDIESQIASKINKSGHIRSQRNAMTNDLREAIKKRDNYTCCLCGNSVYAEPNLLLEVDHIIPISKGGKSEASNLQTLCWRCNREKSNKI